MTTPALPEHYQEKMQGLRRNYLQRLKKSLIDVRRLKELLLKDLAPLKDLQQISLLANNLTGSGATFGFPDISQSAGELQQSLKLMIDVSLASPQNSKKEKQILLDKIDLFYDVSRTAIHQDNITDNLANEKTVKHKITKDSKIIGILSRKQNVISEEMNHLSEQGYKVVYADSLVNLKNIQDMAAAIISDDISSTDERLLNDYLLQEKQIDLDVDFAFYLKDDSFKCRLRALRLGAKMSIADTADGKELHHALSSLIRPPVVKQPHVFIAVKDETLAGLYEHILQQIDIRSTVLKNGKDPLKAMIADPGDMALIDFDLPYCKGAELIEILKHTPNLLNLPTIFMCTADEYQTLQTKPGFTTLLLKPFTPDQLMRGIRHNLNKKLAS